MARIADQVITAYEDPGPWSAWIYGDFGVGKTVFGAGFPNTLILDTERSRRSLLNHPELATRPIIKIKNFPNFKQTVDQIILGQDEVVQQTETVVIDTWTTLQMKELNDQMKEVEKKPGRHPDLPSKSEFNINNTRLRKTLIELLERGNKNVIILSHIKEEKDNEGTTILIRPGNSPSLSSTVASLVDGIFYLSAKTDSKGVFSQKLQCIPSPRVRAKNRFSATLSREIENPKPQDVLDAIKKQRDIITEYLNNHKQSEKELNNA